MNTKSTSASDNIAFTLRDIANKYPEKTGLIEAKSGIRMTIMDLEVLSNQYAAFLQSKGVTPGKRVILMVTPSTDFAALTFGLFKTGATIILIDPGMGYRNLLKCIAKVEPDFFIGVPKACLFKSLFPRVFGSVRRSFCCGKTMGLFGNDVRQEALKYTGKHYPIYDPEAEDLAAIIFTTGSTGPPKGVQYHHGIFQTQLKYISSYYGIKAGDIDQPGFPLFGLFTIALGGCAVIPDMDPTKPALVNPKKFVKSILAYNVSYSFGSPAIWNVVTRYCLENNIKLPGLKKVLMAGAPVPGELIKRVMKILPEDGRIFTPYGATESLPIVSMEGKEIVEQTWQLTQKGEGTCVGRPLPEIMVKIIEPEEGVIESFEKCHLLENGIIGEIIVSGKVITRGYVNDKNETRYAKIFDDKRVWHRMGDMGYIDELGRLWFCGRKAHRVKTENGIMYSVCCEAIANNHQDVFRSALVGVKKQPGDNFDIPVLLIEKEKNCHRDNKKLLREVKELCKKNSLTEMIQYFFVHPAFPVDIRHNAKIFREKLSIWAEKKIN